MFVLKMSMRYAKVELNFNVNPAVKISEIAARTGIPASTIRFYERAGLLPKARRGSNGYRLYQEKVIDCLEVIRLGQSLGFSLDAIRSVSSLEGEALKHAMLEHLQLRLEEVAGLRAALEEQHAALQATLSRLQATWEQDAAVRTSVLLAALRQEGGTRA